MRIDLPTVSGGGSAPGLGIAPGIYPYLGATVGVDRLTAAVARYGCAAIPGLGGACLAVKAHRSAVVDPAAYDAYSDTPQDSAQGELWACDEWLERQRGARVPVLLSDTPRIARGDLLTLRQALRRWDDVSEPALVVLPVESWWLRTGLPWLVEEVREAGRPVALVLVHAYNALDTPGSVAGLVRFISAVGGLAVVPLRCDVSAVGAVAHGAYAGFIGMSASLRHGPLPMSGSRDANGDGKEPDMTPSVMVPALHDYHKAGKLAAIANVRQDLLVCDCSFCRGGSLLEITRLCEVSLTRAREAAAGHSLAMHEQIACQVLGSPRPQDAWWELCKAGADATASLTEDGLQVAIKPWLRQWLELGSPSHDPVTIG